MNGINQQPLINYSADGLKMEEIFRELEKSGKKIDAPTVTALALEKGINIKFLNACLGLVNDEDD